MGSAEGLASGNRGERSSLRVIDEERGESVWANLRRAASRLIAALISVVIIGAVTAVPEKPLELTNDLSRSRCDSLSPNRGGDIGRLPHHRRHASIINPDSRHRSRPAGTTPADCVRAAYGTKVQLTPIHFL